MKGLPKILCLGVASLGAVAAANAQGVLTFDDLPSSSGFTIGYAPIPEGYGGLNWYNFGVIDGSDAGSAYGYYTGVVSPPNVAFNIYGDPASIAVSSGLFDLDSAYLTSALNSQPTQSIQVQGFDGLTMTYNNTYTVNNRGPTLINFDYFGITSVSFTSGSQPFAMDNLTVTVPEPGILALIATGGMAFGLRKWRKRTPW